VVCGACGHEFPLPPPALDAVPVPAAPLPERATETRSHRPRRDDDEDDRPARRDRRERPTSGGISPQVRAGLLIGGAGLAGLLLVGCCGGLIYWVTTGSGPRLGLGDSWSRHTVPGTNLSVEMPKIPAKPVNMKLGNAAGQGEIGALSCDSGGVTFLASVTSLTPPGGMQVPGGFDMGGMMIAAAAMDPNCRVVNQDPVQGRKAVLTVRKTEKGNLVQLLIADGPKTYNLSAVSHSADENHPDVKRFLGSARFD
jgi:hypothetical protein